jgi:hypothetical protein
MCFAISAYSYRKKREAGRQQCSLHHSHFIPPGRWRPQGCATTMMAVMRRGVPPGRIIVVAHPCGRQVTLQQPCFIPPAVSYTDTAPDVYSRFLSRSRSARVPLSRQVPAQPVSQVPSLASLMPPVPPVFPGYWIVRPASPAGILQEQQRRQQQ